MRHQLRCGCLYPCRYIDTLKYPFRNRLCRAETEDCPPSTGIAGLGTAVLLKCTHICHIGLEGGVGGGGGGGGGGG